MIATQAEWLRVVETTEDAAALQSLGLRATPIEQVSRLRLLARPEGETLLVGAGVHPHAPDFYAAARQALVFGVHVPPGSASIASWVAGEVAATGLATARTVWLTLEGGAFAFERGGKATALGVQLRRAARELAPRIFTLGELAARPPKRWLASGFLGAGDLALLCGVPGCYKSFLSLHLATCVAAGAPFLGCKTRQGKVLVLSGEGLAGTRQRALAALGERAGDAGERLLFAEEMPNLLRPEARDGFFAATLALEPALVVVDTWPRLLAAAGANENDASETGLVIAQLDELRLLTGSALVLVHHLRKDATVERGSTALRGASDSAWLLQREGELLARLSCEKQKDAAPLPDRLVRLEAVALGVDDEGCPVSTLRLFDAGLAGEKALGTSGKPRSGLDAVRQCLRNAGPSGLTLAQATEATGLARSSVHRHLRSLTAAGEAVQVPGNGTAQVWRWAR